MCANENVYDCGSYAEPDDRHASGPVTVLVWITALAGGWSLVGAIFLCVRQGVRVFSGS